MLQMRRLYICAVSVLALGLVGCPTTTTPEAVSDADGGDNGDVVSPETGQGDTGPGLDGTSDADAGPGGDADAGPSVPPTDFYYFTSGGGIVSSDNYEARLSIGAPSPRGTATNENHRLRIAPVSP